MGRLSTGTSKTTTSAPRKNEEEEARLHRFFVWLDANGADTSRVRLEQRPGRPRGLFATVDIPAGSTVLTVPYKLFVTAADFGTLENMGPSCLALGTEAREAWTAISLSASCAME